MAVATSAKRKKVTFRIHRGDVVKGKFESRVEEFEVKYNDSTTILQALEGIKAEQDGSLTFRRSCGASICGSCGMVVNNRSRLACKTRIHDILDGDEDKGRRAQSIIEIKPQNSQPVLKDLAVDISQFYQTVHNIKPYVQDGDESEKNVDKTSFEQVNMVSNCIMCGCCYSDCTEMVANPDFLGPAALAKAFRFVSDPREGKVTERLKQLSEENGIWDCTRCGMCMDACPKGVAPMEAIGKLRTRAIAAGVVNNRGAKHAKVFKDDIENFGVLNEFTMMIKTAGILGSIGQLGNAFHLAKKGKVPPPLPHKVEGLSEVSAIYKALEEDPIDVETKQLDTGPGAG